MHVEALVQPPSAGLQAGSLGRGAGPGHVIPDIKIYRNPIIFLNFTFQTSIAVSRSLRSQDPLTLHIT